MSFATSMRGVGPRGLRLKGSTEAAGNKSSLLQAALFSFSEDTLKTMVRSQLGWALWC